MHTVGGISEALADSPALLTRFSFALPWARIDGVVLPFLAAADHKHDHAEEEHDESPAEVEVDAEGLLIDGGVACEQAIESHHASGDEEDEAEGDADVESHGCSGCS